MHRLVAIKGNYRNEDALYTRNKYWWLFVQIATTNNKLQKNKVDAAILIRINF